MFVEGLRLLLFGSWRLFCVVEVLFRVVIFVVILGGIFELIILMFVVNLFLVGVVDESDSCKSKNSEKLLNFVD